MAAMVQELVNQSGVLSLHFQQSDNTVPVSPVEFTSDTLILNGGYETLTLEVANVGPTNPLASFEIDGKAHPDGAWQNDLFLEYVEASDIPVSITEAGSSEFAILHGLKGVYALRFRLSADTGSVTVHIRGVGSP